MVQDTPSRKLDQYIVRMPDGMRDRLKTEAKKSGRSLNAEIVHRLANSLQFRRFEDAGFDFGLGFDEDLNFELLNAASMNGRPLMGEIVARLKDSFKSEPDLVYELQRQTYVAKRDLDRMMRLFIQMTPEERRILEERADIIEKAKDFGFSSRDVAKLTALQRIGGKGRRILTKPPVDYSFLLKKEPYDHLDDLAEIGKPGVQPVVRQGDDADERDDHPDS